MEKPKYYLVLLIGFTCSTSFLVLWLILLASRLNKLTCRIKQLNKYKNPGKAWAAGYLTQVPIAIREGKPGLNPA